MLARHFLFALCFLFCPQLFGAVLVLEELEKAALALVEAEKQAELLAKKELVTAEAFAQLRPGTKCVGVVGGCGFYLFV